MPRLSNGNAGGAYSRSRGGELRCTETIKSQSKRVPGDRGPGYQFSGGLEPWHLGIKMVWPRCLYQSLLQHNIGSLLASGRPNVLRLPNVIEVFQL